MIKRKQEAKECEEEAPYVFRRLRRAYYDGLLGTAEYEQWYERFLVAKVEKDCEFPSEHVAKRDKAGGSDDLDSEWHAQDPGAPEDPRERRPGGAQPAVEGDHRAPTALGLVQQLRFIARGVAAEQGQPAVPSGSAGKRGSAPRPVCPLRQQPDIQPGIVGCVVHEAESEHFGPSRASRPKREAVRQL